MSIAEEIVEITSKIKLCQEARARMKTGLEQASGAELAATGAYAMAKSDFKLALLAGEAGAVAERKLRETWRAMEQAKLHRQEGLKLYQDLELEIEKMEAQRENMIAARIVEVLNES